VNIKIKFDHILALLILLIGLFGLVYRQTIQRTLLSGTEQSLQVGSALKIVGTSERRPFDTLSWLNLDEGEAIRSGDFIRTKSESQLDITLLQKGDVLKLGPNTLVRLTLDGNMIVLDLRQGQVQANFSPKQLIRINKPGESVGQDLKYQEQIKKAEPTEDHSSQNGDDKTPAQSTAPQPLPPKKWQAYPKNGVFIFYSSDNGKLDLHLFETCQGECHLKLLLNGAVWREWQRVALLSTPVSLALTDRPVGHITWTYEDATHHDTGTFELRPFDAKAIESALKAGQPIEILP
jgi:hypothetical protein